MKKPDKAVDQPHLGVSATLATQVNLLVSDDGWRLAFGEQTGETSSVYHSAVFLPTRTAHQLVDLMLSSAQKQKNADPNKAG